jgi:hypothetical protein
VTPHVINNHVVSSVTAVRGECARQRLIRLVELNGAGCAEIAQLLEHTLVAPRGDDMARTEPPCILHAFVSPVAVEPLIVPLAVGIGWLEFGRFVALRSTPLQSARV